MSITKKFQSELMADAAPGDSSYVNPQLTAKQIKEWVSTLPDDAVIIPLSTTRGHYRDKWLVVIGLRASWERSHG